jgi:hypothetical protein
MSGRKLHVYVAGAYSGATAKEVEANVRVAMDAGDRLEDLGLRAFIPHLSHFRHARKARPYEEWMDIDFDWIRRCDALFRIRGKSSGGDREVAFARGARIPVFFDEADLRKWAMAEDSDCEF